MFFGGGEVAPSVSGGGGGSRSACGRVMRRPPSTDPTTPARGKAALQAAQEDSMSKPRYSLVGTASHGRPSLLAVSQQPDTLAEVAALAGQDFEVHTASGGGAALQALTCAAFDLLLADQAMRPM